MWRAGSSAPKAAYCTQSEKLTKSALHQRQVCRFDLPIWPSFATHVKSLSTRQDDGTVCDLEFAWIARMWFALAVVLVTVFCLDFVQLFCISAWAGARACVWIS